MNPTWIRHNTKHPHNENKTSSVFTFIIQNISFCILNSRRCLRIHILCFPWAQQFIFTKLHNNISTAVFVRILPKRFISVYAFLRASFRPSAVRLISVFVLLICFCVCYCVGILETDKYCTNANVWGEIQFRIFKFMRTVGIK